MGSSSERYDRALEEPTRQQGKLDANTGQEAGRHLKASLMRREGGGGKEEAMEKQRNAGRKGRRQGWREGASERKGRDEKRN